MGQGDLGRADRSSLEGDASIGALFRRYEQLPANDAFEEKASLTARIVAVLTRHPAAGDRRIRDLIARLEMTSPEVPDHDAIVLELIDTARVDPSTDEHVALPDLERSAEPRRPSVAHRGDDAVDEGSQLSFPASDPPAY